MIFELLLLIASGFLVFLTIGPISAFVRGLLRRRRRRPMFAEYFPDDDPKRRLRRRGP